VVLQNRSASGSPEVSLKFITGAFDLADSRYSEIASSGTNNSNMVFRTSASGAPTDRMTILSSGNVGIGTTNPTRLLDVAKTGGTDTLALRVSGTGTGLTYLDVNSDNTADTSGALLRLITKDVADTATNAVNIVKYATGAFYINNEETNAAAKIGFAIAGTEHLTLLSSGNVGIGTASPTFHLQVESSADNQFRVIGKGTTWGGNTLAEVYSERSTLGTGTGSLFLVGSGAKPGMLTVKDNGDVGIGTTSPSYTLHVNGSVAGTSAYNNLSDGRLKKNVVAVDDALNKIIKLRGVTFDWRKDEHPDLNLGARQELGVIAQEVEAVFPQAVSEDKNTKIKSVAYSMLISPIIESIKQLRSWLVKQDRSIASVNERVDVSDSKIELLRISKDKEIKELKSQLQKQNDRLSTQNIQIQNQAKELEEIKKKLAMGR
jgi:hypothetical protein